MSAVELGLSSLARCGCRAVEIDAVLEGRSVLAAVVELNFSGPTIWLPWVVPQVSVEVPLLT